MMKDSQSAISTNEGKAQMLLRLPTGATVSHHADSSSSSKFEPRYFFGLCPVSLNSPAGPSGLKACAGCLSVGYAGRQEQKADWKRHKALCKTLQPLVDKSSSHPLGGHPERHGQLQTLLQSTLGRELTQFESDVLVYPRLCMVCLEGDQSRLTNCPACHCAAYCSSPPHSAEDAALHGLSCRLLRVCLEDHAAEMRWGHPALEGGFFPSIRDSYRELPPTISDFFRSDLSSFFRQLTDRESAGNDDALQQAELRHLTFRFSCQLSLLHGLERAGLAGGIGLDSAEGLTVHVVGARAAESDDVTRWEVLAGNLPRLQRLTVVLVGPELSWSFPTSDFFHESPSLKHRRPNLTVRYILHKAHYHEVQARLPRPDCVAALNCGFIFYKSWDASLPSMLRWPGVPLVFTEYYLEDCGLDLEKVEEAVEEGLEVCVPPSENAYCSQLPARIPTGFAFRRFGRRNVVMSNDFICVIRRKI